MVLPLAALALGARILAVPVVLNLSVLLFPRGLPGASSSHPLGTVGSWHSLPSVSRTQLPCSLSFSVSLR